MNLQGKKNNKRKGKTKMVAIFKYQNGLQFTGIVAETEEKAWAYLDKKIGEENKVKIDKHWYYPKANRKAFEIRPVTLI